MKKIILWSMVLILILGLAGGAAWWLLRPQVIVFDTTGDKVTLLAVDYGKKHVPPGVKTTGTTARTRTTRGSSFNTTNDTLVLWVRQEHDPQQRQNFQYYLYDQAGTACAEAYGGGNNGRSGSEIVPVQFSAFPRRQGKLILRVQEQSNTGQEMSQQKISISNPARGPFSTWTAEPLPNTQQDDDFSATLTKLVASAEMPYKRIQDGDEDDAANKGVLAAFHAGRNGIAATNWEPLTVETTDATGNSVNGGVSKNDWQDNADTVVYQYGLWPDEAAWKLRVEFSQKADFAANELWSAKNIPVQPGRQNDFYNGRRSTTNSAFAETDLNGFHLKVFPAKVFTDVGQSSQQGGMFIQIEPPLPGGMHLTILKLTDDQTNDIGFWENTYMQSRTVSMTQCQLRDLGGATNLNLTIALHKSRFVEFLAKPEKAPAAAAAP